MFYRPGRRPALSTAGGRRARRIGAGGPLRRGKTPFGLLALFNRRDRFFTAQDRAWLEAIAGKCEDAIENARLVGQLAEQERLKRDLEIAARFR